MAEEAEELLAMRRPPALSVAAEEPTAERTPEVTTPKKRWMLRWRLQHQPNSSEATGTDKPPPPLLAGLAVDGGGDGGGEGRGGGGGGRDSRSPSGGGGDSSAVIAASISPSAKTKDPEAPRTPSPAKMPMAQDQDTAAAEEEPSQASSVDCATAETAEEMARREDRPASPKRERPDASTPSATPADSSPTTTTTAMALDRQEEDDDADRELTESERQRLARRKRRKSNWDVGDPRKHGGSVDLAALDLLSSINPPATHPASFAKFPRQRPTYRHSHSLEPAAPPYRAPVFGHGALYASPPSAPRRAFHHATSLPPERTRPLRGPPPGHR